ncbi:MAG TPA: hypothetical protein VNE41_05940 [Chitinophagaceae bacterium]|nr:hypothetical protein [Chitinophagaceae bacterium]
MGRNFTWLVLLLLLFMIPAYGQNKYHFPPSNQRIREIRVEKDSILLDTLSIIPGSIQIKGVPDSTYRYDAAASRLLWISKPRKDSVRVTYRVFPFSFTRSYYHKDIRKLNDSYVLAPYVYRGGEGEASRFIDFGNLNYNGSFGRGISFGNNQDLVVNSSLNMQLSGMLADSIRLVAAISDNNVPFQPEGNTANLQSLDKVFIQFSKGPSRLILGDFDIGQYASHFMHFSQRLEGLSFGTVIRTSPADSDAFGISGAVTKGKFAQNIFQGQEGNQGPYRLHGASGEQYLIVLAGTEKVFINGQLMKRGQDQDYIIDYNTAELTFTPRNLITNDSRIQVEFEYTANSYLNSQLYLTDSWNAGSRLRITLNAFSNQDAKNSPISQALDASQIRFLGQVGDSLSKAYYPAVARDTFSSGQVLYALTDSVIGALTYDSIFTYSTSPDSALFTLSFSFVGQGNGNYIPQASGANGQVYQWVVPSNGVPQGSYAPVVLLVTPKKQQLFTLAADYRINSHSTLKAEAALSNNDVNLYSRIQKSGDLGMAAHAIYRSREILAGNGKSQTDLVSSVSYEYAASHFKPLEPFRDIEFYRDWSLGLGTVLPTADENLVDASVGLDKTGLGSIGYDISGFFRGATYSGIRNVVTGSLSLDGFLLNGQFNITKGKGVMGNSSFFRPRLDVSKSFPKLGGLVLGSSYSQENNQIRSITGDTLSSQSFDFNTWAVYLKTSASLPNRVGISYTQRTDAYPRGALMIRADVNHILNISGQVSRNPHQQLNWNITYHQMQVSDSVLSGQQPDQGVLGRLEYMINLKRGFLVGSTVYETGSGQQLRQSFTYVQVPAGQGDYVWIDYNHDSIQQVNEFQKAAYQDQGNFIQVYTPTNQYVRTNNVQFNQSIALDPRMLFSVKQRGGMARFLSRFSSQTSFQISRSQQAGGLGQFNPFQQHVQDTSLISISSLITNAVFFNRLSPVWSLDYTSSVSNNKSLMAYGFESSHLVDNVVSARWNLNKRFTAGMKFQSGVNGVYSPSYANLNYQLKELAFSPRMDYTYFSKFRVTLDFTRDSKANTPAYGGETSLSNALGAGLKYNVLSASTLDIQLTYNQISFSGQSNSTVGYTMLGGLVPGQNILWNLGYTRRIAGNIEMDLQYEGRKPGRTRVIHSGQVSVRALF